MSVSASEVSSGKMKRVAISYGNYIQFADGVSHELNEAPAGALSVVGITIYAPDGSYVKGLTSNSGVYNANLKIIEFDVSKYGSGKYTINVILQKQTSDGRKSTVDVSWN